MMNFPLGGEPLRPVVPVGQPIGLRHVRRPERPRRGRWLVAAAAFLAHSFACTTVEQPPAKSTSSQIATPSAPVISSEPAQALGCHTDADRILATKDQQGLDRTLTALQSAYDRCGNGHGLLSAIAQVRLARGELSDASAAVTRELLSQNPSPRATSIARVLANKLPPGDASRLRELGSSAETPVHLRSILGDRDAWLIGVTCLGEAPKSFSLERADRVRLYKAIVECPAGTRHTVFFWEDGEAPQKKPTFTVDTSLPSVTFVLAQLKGRFGASTAADLRDELLDPVPSRGLGWLLNNVNDWPSSINVWKTMIDEDPDDLGAVISRANVQAFVGHTDEAMATLSAASLVTGRVRDLRGENVATPSTIRSKQCALLLRQRRLDEAERRGREGLNAGAVEGLGAASRIASHACLARVYLLKGNLPYAYARSLDAARDGSFPEWTLVGLVLTLQGHSDYAKAWLQKAAAAGSKMATMLLANVEKGAEGWILEEEAEDRELAASRLAGCGLMYLELNVPERASRCLKASENLMYGPAEAARALYLAETDPQKALLTLQPALKKSHDSDTLVAMAAIQHRLGHDAEALDWLMRAFEARPGHVRGKGVLADVCKNLNRPPCPNVEQREN